MEIRKKKLNQLGMMLLTFIMLCVAGCSKPDDPIDNPNNGGGNGSGQPADPNIEGPDILTFHVDDVSFDMRKVIGGTFWMGSQNTNPDGQNFDTDAGHDIGAPVHEVTLSGFYMGKYEVTQELWQAVMGNNPSQFHGENLPVENVGWSVIQDFLSTLNSKVSDQLPEGMQFRLPTEAQWEYAARGGNQSYSYTYSGSNDLSSVAWYENNGGGETHPIGMKNPNALFLYDMSGNVAEWCSDYYTADDGGLGYVGSPQTDPIGPSQTLAGEEIHVLRGGHYAGLPNTCRVSCHYWVRQAAKNIGLRLVLSKSVGQASVPGMNVLVKQHYVTTNSASARAGFVSDGGAYPTEWGFYYGTSPDPITSGTKLLVTELDSRWFNALLENLQPGTNYYVCAYGKNEVGTAYSEVVMFTTQIDVNTMEVTGITYASAICGGTIPNGDETVSDKGICWSQMINPVINDDHISAGSGSGSFSVQIYGLEPNTTYHVRAYAIVDNNVSYGNEVVFITNPPQVPTVETVSASCGYFYGFGLYNWDATGKIISDGGANINYNKVGFVVSKYPYPTWSGGVYGNELSWEGNMQDIGREFTSYGRPGELLDLNTTYYIRAFAANSVGIGYGDVIQITTGGMPSAVIETYPVTDITSNSAVCSGYVNASGFVERMGVCWDTSPNPEVQNYGGGIFIEAPVSNGAFTLTITGLMPNTTYYVRTFAFGEFEGEYGENQVFTTLP